MSTTATLTGSAIARRPLTILSLDGASVEPPLSGPSRPVRPPVYSPTPGQSSSTTLQSARNATKPPLPPKPHYPRLSFNVDNLPTFMHFSTFVEYIAPWADYTFTEDDVPASSDPPPWTGWLESYYQAFHPKAWAILDEEYKALTKYVSDMNDWVEVKRRLWELSIADVGSETAEIRYAKEERKDRFEILYCLHYVREQYLDYYRRLLPGNSDDMIIAQTTTMEGHRGSQVPRHSVWPLPCPVPRDPSSPIRQPLTSVSHLSADDVEFAPYQVPYACSEGTSHLVAAALELYSQQTSTSSSATPKDTWGTTVDSPPAYEPSAVPACTG
ncbi:hypothetical protein JCM11641_004343 [Rhodosporidiobolus odoratus]